MQFERNTNTVDNASNKDNLTFGLSNEFAWGNLWGATQYIRGNGELVTDFEGKTKNWAFVAEWQPIGNPAYDGSDTIFSYLGTPLPLGPSSPMGGPYFVFSVSPKAKLEYRGDLGQSIDPIFDSRNSVLRGGPTVTLAIDGVTVLDYVPWWVRSIHFQLTYGYLYDFLSAKDYSLLDTSLTFKLDPSGHFGLTVSYRRGEIEQTGQKVDTTQVTFSTAF